MVNMRIEDFYDELDKSNFYLGMVSQVYRSNIAIQVENLTLLAFKKLKNTTIIPNTINYFVAIDSNDGIYFGELFQSKIQNGVNSHEMVAKGFQENIYPELNIDILGFIPIGDKFFKLPGTHTVGLTDKVYIADRNIIEHFVSSIEVKPNSEKKLSSFSNLSLNSQNYPISFQPRTLFDRHLLTIGTTNSGKSTSALSILDKLISNNIRTLIIDPTGEYSLSFSEDEVDKYVLGEKAFVPVSELSMQQWSILFETNDGTQPAVLAEAIRGLRYQLKQGFTGPYVKIGKSVNVVERELNQLIPNDKDFDLSLLSEQIANETTQQTNSGVYKADAFNFGINQYLIQKVNYKLANTNFKTFFSSQKENLLDIIKNFATTSKKSLYIDASRIGTTDGIGGMIIDLVTNFLLNIPKNEINSFVIFIDEVHRYTKSNKVGETSFYTGLTGIAREGRKKGIFLFLTTQNPNDVDKVLLGQIGTLLIHRLTAIDEIRAISNHLSEQQIAQVRKLNTGEAVLTSINLLKDLYLEIEKCDRVHMNDTPSLWQD